MTTSKGYIVRISLTPAMAPAIRESSYLRLDYNATARVSLGLLILSDLTLTHSLKMPNLEIPIFLLLSTPLPGRKVVQKEVSELVLIDIRTSVLDIVSAVVSKHIHPSQIPAYALYQTELVSSEIQKGPPLLQRKFYRALELDECPLLLMLHDAYACDRPRAFYIKRKDLNENVSIFADLRRARSFKTYLSGTITPHAR